MENEGASINGMIDWMIEFGLTDPDLRLNYDAEIEEESEEAEKIFEEKNRREEARRRQEAKRRSEEAKIRNEENK